MSSGWGPRSRGPGSSWPARSGPARRRRHQEQPWASETWRAQGAPPGHPYRAATLACALVIGAAGGAAYLAQRSGDGGSSAVAARQRPAVDDAVADSRTIVVTATAAHGCTTDRTTYASGNLVVSFTNRDATGVDSVVLLAGNRIMGERERIPAGATGSFQATLQPGRYELFCPGAANERVALSIRGTAVPAAGPDPRALLRAGAITYGR